MATAADLMTVDIPRSDRHRTVGDMIAALQDRTWDEVGHIYLVDDQATLVGQVRIERLLQAKEQTYLTELEGSPPLEVLPGDEAETVALRAVERHDADVAVVGCWAPFRSGGSWRCCMRNMWTISCGWAA